MPDKDAKDPSTTSLSYDAMSPDWALIQVLLDGTNALRAAGEAYTPKHEEESTTAYNERVAACTLLNIMELTVEQLVGRPFGDPVILNDDVPAEIRELTNNIDLQGNDLQNVARGWFKSALAKTFSHMLIEFPRAPEPEEGRRRTRADDLRENLRPYWVPVAPENLIFAAAEIIDGREVLTHVRIKEIEVKQVGFAEVEVERIRVLEPGRQEIWEKRETKAGGRKKVEWVRVDEFETGLDFIPLVTFYTNREAFMFGKPPLLDLGHLNIRHWQSTSDQIAVVTVARFPLLGAVGIDEETDIVIGPRQLLAGPIGSKFYYIEHTGSSIEAGRKDLSELEQQMAHYGSQLLRKRLSNDTTATERVLDTQEALSPLQAMTLDFVSSLETALDMTAQWLKLDSGGTVSMTTDFEVLAGGDQDMQFLLQLREARDMSRKSILIEARRRQMLPDSFDADADLVELEKETMDLPDGGTDDDLDEAGEE